MGRERPQGMSCTPPTALKCSLGLLAAPDTRLSHPLFPIAGLNAVDRARACVSITTTSIRYFWPIQAKVYTKSSEGHPKMVRGLLVPFSALRHFLQNRLMCLFKHFLSLDRPFLPLTREASSIENTFLKPVWTIQDVAPRE